MSSKTRRRNRERRTKELRDLWRITGIDVLEFSPIHFRLIGAVTVDYWPSTGMSWIVSSSEPGRVMEPSEVIWIVLGKDDQNCELSREFGLIAQ